MPSVRNSRNKRKKNSIVIERIAYSLFYLFSIVIFYLIWDIYRKETIVWEAIYVYIIVYLAFLVGFILIINDIYNNYNYFKNVKDKKGTELIEDIHFLCANPICPRCGGWYWGLTVSLMITLAFKDSVISILNDSVLSPYILIVLGVLIFMITTPFHGVLNFLTKKNQKTNDKLKLAFGIISGLSLSVIVFGISMLLN
ncbi:MAG: hypothetical protein AEth_00645 [Candidatus Argoarchaeum ethanivorans]|uniref:DUF2085 domain-containing protein n=1 Tax=Candidatus Argoarchaeum ethanivorans TaxID=2608793 RepID=A0A8B3S2G5_9EURY|nr:MAG: hypothetical protein AEth_00645 [Candidatus Argoarchaeum ethanivorans]